MTGLVRATVEESLSAVTVPAEDLETLRIIITLEPDIYTTSSAWAKDTTPMFRSIIIHVVDGEEFDCPLAAAGTLWLMFT